MVIAGILLLRNSLQGTGLFSITIGLILLGVGYAFYASPNMNAIMGSVDKKSYGVAASIEGTVRLIGATFSTGIVMLLFTVKMGTAQITPQYYDPFVDSLKIAFLIFIGICVCSTILSITRGKLVSMEK